MIRVSGMRIGEVASEAAVNIQTLRYYERVGLLPQPPRGSSGYRAYTPDTVHRVRFIKRAQELGFTLGEISGLLTLREQSETSCELVEARVSATLERITGKIRDLERMRAGLSEYLTTCRERQPAEGCPVLRSLDRLTEDSA